MQCSETLGFDFFNVLKLNLLTFISDQLFHENDFVELQTLRSQRDFGIGSRGLFGTEYSLYDFFFVLWVLLPNVDFPQIHWVQRIELDEPNNELQKNVHFILAIVFGKKWQSRRSTFSLRLLACRKGFILWFWVGTSFKDSPEVFCIGSYFFLKYGEQSRVECDLDHSDTAEETARKYRIFSFRKQVKDFNLFLLSPCQILFDFVGK